MIGNEKDYEQFLEEERNKSTHIVYGSKVELFRRHQLTLNAYEKQLFILGGFKKVKAQYNYDMQEIKKKHMYAITQELDGGNTLKYKNRESRDAELASRLRLNPDYQKINDMNEDLEDQMIDAEIKVEVIKRTIKFYEVWA